MKAIESAPSQGIIDASVQLESILRQIRMLVAAHRLYRLCEHECVSPAQ